MVKKMKREIAPRLASGECRVPLYGRLPDPIKEGIRDIARAEGKSISWVIEQTVIKFFGLHTPVYQRKLKGEIVQFPKRRAATINRTRKRRHG